MTLENAIHLEGTLHGPCWTRWKTKERGQVRFWLAVSREVAGEGFDLFLVAIEPRTGDEIRRLESELTEGRTCSVSAHAKSLVHGDRALMAQEGTPGVIFVAEECGLDGAATRNAHQLGALPRRHAAHGKMAAAGDVESAELQLEGQP